MTTKSPLAWMALWVSLAAAFGAAIAHWYGPAHALDFATAYVVEGSLSVDNLFIFYLIFQFFAVAPELQHRVLFWGVLGALVLRGIFVITGVALLEHFHWLTYLFGAFLVFTGFRLFFHDPGRMKPERNPVVRMFRRFIPMSPAFVENQFSVRRDGRWLATPLLLVLVLVEATDVAFATDSIPAVLAISRDPFIVYSSNVFAVLGLRSLYFVLAGMLGKLRYLNYGLAVVLGFTGAKMLLSAHFAISTGASLAVVGAVIGTAIVASLLVAQPHRVR